MSEQSALLLQKQLRGTFLEPANTGEIELRKDPVEWFSAGLVGDNIYEACLLVKERES